MWFAGGRTAMKEIDTGRVREVIRDPDSLDRETYDWCVGKAKQLVRQLLYGNSVQSLHSATTIVDEAFLNTIKHFRQNQLNNREHFYAVLIKASKREVLNLFESERASKRGGDVQRISFDEARDLVDKGGERELFELFETFSWLEHKKTELPGAIELLFDHVVFGKSLADCASEHGMSVSTVQRRIRALLGMLRADVGLNGEKS